MKYYPIPSAVYYYDMYIFSTKSRLGLVAVKYSIKVEIFERV